jgi:hypothetical protein
MGCYHDATAPSIGTHYHLGAVIERPDVCTFRATELLIWGKREPKLDLGSQKYLVIFATHDERQASQIREGGSGAILAVEPQQYTFCSYLVDCEVVLDLGHGSA